MSRSFLKYAFSLFILIGITTASYAQDDANMPRPNTKAGSAAWMFEFGGLSSLGMTGFALPGSTMEAAGWKWYFADDMALRALLGFSTKSSGADSLTGGHTTATGFGIGVGVEMHTHPVYSTSPYFGAQISFADGSNDNTAKTTEGNFSTTSENKTSSSTFGIGVLAGFDWYFTRGIAIGGEYMLGFTTTSSSTVTTTTVNNNGTSTSTSKTVDNPSATSFGISSADIHLVVHF
jgi:hypothetical protein